MPPALGSIAPRDTADTPVVGNPEAHQGPPSLRSPHQGPVTLTRT